MKYIKQENELLRLQINNLTSSVKTPTEKLIVDEFYRQAPSSKEFFFEKWKRLNLVLEELEEIKAKEELEKDKKRRVLIL